MDLLTSFPWHWVWLGLALLFGILELSTTALVSVWLMVGALAALISSIFIHSLPVQALVFALVSILALAATRPLVRRLQARHRPAATGADRNIGRTATVLEPIDPQKPGRVRLDGVNWNAVSETRLPANALCTVQAVQGTTLTVAPLAAPSDPTSL